jgi:large subunit ribosomal protein L16
MTILKFKRKFKIKKLINIKNEFLGLCQFGFYGIKALNSAVITPNQIETSRRVIIRVIKRVGKVYVRAIFHYAITAKSSGTRMGKGKGNFIG